MHKERRRVAEMLRRFVSNESGPYELDDFISCSSDDPLLEHIRELVHHIPELYPPALDTQYTSDEGAAKLLAIADELDINSI